MSLAWQVANTRVRRSTQSRCWIRVRWHLRCSPIASSRKIWLFSPDVPLQCTPPFEVEIGRRVADLHRLNDCAPAKGGLHNAYDRNLVELADPRYSMQSFVLKHPHRLCEAGMCSYCGSKQQDSSCDLRLHAMEIPIGWVKAPELASGLNHLGSQASCAQIYSQHLPGITNMKG